MRIKLILLLALPFIGFSQLSGNYIISSSNSDVNFKTLAAAVAQINSVGASGPVNFLLDENQTLTAPIAIDQYTGSSATNFLTIKPNTGKTNLTITGSLGNASTAAIIKLNGADYVVIDGSNNGTTTRDLTISNTSTQNYNDQNVTSAILWLASTGDGSNSNKIKNINFIGANIDYSSSTSAGIVFGSSTSMNTAEAVSNSSNQITNNTFKKIKIGVWILGGTDYNTGVLINKNEFGSTDADKVLVFSALKLSNIQTALITNNTILGVSLPSNSGTVYGIYLYGKSLNSTIDSNTISNITNTQKGPARGIFVDINASFDSNLTLSNNIINNVTSVNPGQQYETGNAGQGIYINKGRKINILNNTVVVDKDQDVSSSALYVKSGSLLDVRNNIFVNTQNNGRSFAVYSEAPVSAFSTINNNNYYVNNSANSWIGYIGGNQDSLADWQAATGGDTTSLSILPVFVSSTDFRLKDDSANAAFSANGMGATPACEIPAVPTVGTTTQPSCSTTTGSVILSGLTGTGTINQTGTVAGTYTITGTTMTISSLATGTYQFSASTGSCTSALTTNVVINSSATTWTGASWNNGTPTSSSAAIIAGAYSEAANINACTLTINNNAVVSIPSGYNVTLGGALTVSSGSFTLENNANLIQTSNAVNSGNINVKRNSSDLFRLDYTMWSSPVAESQTLEAFSPLTATSRFYEYNTTTNLYNTVANTTGFSLAKGYLIRTPNTWVEYNNGLGTAASWTGTFTGVPNNGTISYTMSTAGSGYNAVGNPYPSTLNVDNFISGNTANIDGTLYFWRKRNDVTNATSYSTCTSAGCSINNGHTYLNADYIPVGQGFIVKATSTTLNFTNSMRVANNQNQFFKTKAVEKNRIWLNLFNDTTPVNQMLLAYMTGATMKIDPTDGAYINDSQTALNSLIGSEEFAIQGRSLPFDAADEVPLSFKAVNPGNYTIAIDHVDGLFLDNQEIILKDNTTGTETNLKSGAYTFTAAAGVSNTRFSLKYQKTLGINNPIFDENTIVIFKNNSKLQIKSNGTSIDNVKIYDIRGSLLFEKNKVNANETSIETSGFSNQVLIVQITSEDNKIVNKKVVN